MKYRQHFVEVDVVVVTLRFTLPTPYTIHLFVTRIPADRVDLPAWGSFPFMPTCLLTQMEEPLTAPIEGLLAHLAKSVVVTPVAGQRT